VMPVVYPITYGALQNYIDVSYSRDARRTEDDTDRYTDTVADDSTRVYTRATNFEIVPSVQYVDIAYDGSIIKDAAESESVRVYRSTYCTLDSVDDEQKEQTEGTETTCRQTRSADSEDDTEDANHPNIVRNYRATGSFLVEDPTVQLYVPVDECTENNYCETAFYRTCRETEGLTEHETANTGESSINRPCRSTDTTEHSETDASPQTETCGTVQTQRLCRSIDDSTLTETRGAITEDDHTLTRPGRSADTDTAESIATPVLREIRYDEFS
jgi:hypothetical protein